MKKVHKQQYRKQLQQYVYISKIEALRLDFEIWDLYLTLKERLDIYNSVFDY